MKKLHTSIGLFLATLLSAQVPQAFSYQTIAFNASGAPIANGNVALKISILENSATGTVLYTETHNKTTNAKGLVNLNIGQGTATTGTFGGINWGTNTKFVKVEMDPAGGSNYTNVGVNQLMSVPYSQVSKTVVTGAGQGITLTSPNGTAYTLNVSDSGTLSLPTTSSSSSTAPTNLYMYGSHNSFNATTAELLRNVGTKKIGYRYLPANTQLKFISSQANGAQVYGAGSQSVLVPNGSDFNISSNGFYEIAITDFGPSAIIGAENIVPSVDFIGSYPSSMTPLSYNVTNNTFSTQVFGITNTMASTFVITVGDEEYGDNLSDGNIDVGGSSITFPNLTSTPKNYQITFTINFNGTGTYTITQI
ncbi:hypothetical protein NAL32_20730 [Chryseobacterium sp. Ch-15]|uniref:Uncharacterized protein n=1 Tax=Chryseobacterium muglaense TaxID=2893752 RepID=A0A9Q3YUK1_9FLAO|nr:hypothetical protein [Chryseobacterium muglaense]MBD3907148.1 hypothetical protein [Chryseobacterium muglaense]MCC9033775.1 hypothetical protein [Chryseobacterium muglaense]MCM2556817.1 hypothetical protein [Chryseobacterium muglaense]